MSPVCQRRRASLRCVSAPGVREELFDARVHERLTESGWDPERARAAIRTIMVETESAFDEVSLWAAHPLDEEPGEDLDASSCVYLGASGVIWARTALAEGGDADPGRDWSDVAASLPARYLAAPDFPDAGVEPSLMLGEAGIVLVAHGLSPSVEQEERLLDLVRGNADNPALELFWGAPGTMLAAQVMHERTGGAEWADAWHDSADRVWAAWEGDLWRQEIRGRPRHILGPAHGFVGNVHALARGDFLDDERRAELERRTVAAIVRHARRSDGMAQWPETLEPPNPAKPWTVRTQWCHGAPGIVTSLATLAPANDELTGILLEGGELVWHAGPLVKGSGICHGTAGNGHAFLKLFERTGDELWLERARRFAMHATEQSERACSEYGMGRHSLWSGDPGVALYLASCLDARADLPTFDTF